MIIEHKFKFISLWIAFEFFSFLRIVDIILYDFTGLILMINIIQ